MRAYFAAVAALLAAAPAVAQQGLPALSEARVIADVKALTDDRMEGRAPGGAGEERTIAWLIAEAKKIGLEPAGDKGGWTQDVPLLHTQFVAKPPAAIVGGSIDKPRLRSWSFGKDFYVSSPRNANLAAVTLAPLVFVGYGVAAPERQWDDFKGEDLKGKIAVFLVNDPDFEAAPGEAVAGTFGGKTMTYYGRWTYKYEEAMRRGALGALIVHDTAGAGYGWNVVNAPGGELYGHASPKLPPLMLQGWIAGDAAAQLFADAGLDLAAMRKAARRADFKPVSLKSRMTFAAPVKTEVIQSRNVLAKISGAGANKDEAVTYGAHWDAYGKGAPDKDGKIYRAGANDDALGVAGLLEIARSMKAAKAQPQRTVLFGFWTAEERGLLGSDYYNDHPTWPTAKTVANLGIDVLQTAGKARNVILVGQGQSSLEDDLARFAAKQGRVVTPEGLPERGLFYRADHFAFAKRGVPVLLMMGMAGAADLVDGGTEAGQAWIDDYTGRCYHAACDAYGPAWKLAGAMDDIALMRDIGWDLANSTRWPTWKPGSEFAKLRPAPKR